MKKVLLLLVWMLLTQLAWAQSADVFFHDAAKYYCANQMKKAKAAIREGLWKNPNDEKLKSLLKKLIQKEQEQQKKEEQKKQQEKKKQQQEKQKQQQQEQKKQDQQKQEQQKKDASQQKKDKQEADKKEKQQQEEEYKSIVQDVASAINLGKDEFLPGFLFQSWYYLLE